MPTPPTVPPSPQDERERARAAAAGQTDWGQWGSAEEHLRYLRPAPDRRSKCRCGCGARATHHGAANGVALVSGCELSVRRWVRDGR